jgi:hypothetical protein
MLLPFPRWLVEMPDGPEKDRATDVFFIQLGCVYASQTGKMKNLAETIGINYSTLRSQVNDRRILYVSEKTLEAVERVIGIEVIAWGNQELMFQRRIG